MIFRIIQYLGLTVIILFSAISILLSSTARELKNNASSDSFLLNYASFFEDRFFDLRMRMTVDKKAIDNRIVLAAIDDNSLTKIGRWPWSRTKITELINKLDSFEAKVISFDIFFSEPEMACNTQSPDVIFANTIKNFQSSGQKKIILPYSVIEIEKGEKIDETYHIKELPDQMYNFVLDTRQAQNANLTTYIASRNVFPIKELIESDAGLAHILADADQDGVFRHYPTVANIDGIYYPSFGLLAYEYFSGDKPVLNIMNNEGAYIQTKKGKMHLNANGESKIRWFGGMNKFPVIPIYNILNSKDGDPDMVKIFKNKLVFVGSTAFGAHDLRNTPVDPMLPGIFFHMNLVHMLLDGKFHVFEDESTKLTWIMLLVGTFTMILVMLLGNAILDIFTSFTIIGGLFLIDTYYFIPLGYNNRLFFCLFSVLNCYSWSTFLHFYQSNKEKKKIKGTFSRYLAPSIVNDLLKNPEKVRLGGEKKNITVFFSDVRDFTSISEKLSPEQLSYCLNKYMTMMTDTLFEHQGTLDKYIGDAMVAYWGAPVDIKNHAYWAVKGALNMIEKLPAINQEFEREGFPLFKHGIGLNTGECSVGNMGSNQIFSYTALGDNMNLGARLESLCKFYGVELNISEYTKDAIPLELQKDFTFRTLDKVKVKGKEKAVTIYEVLHSTHPLKDQTEALQKYEEAFQLYLNSDFFNALEIFSSLNQKYPDDKSFERMLHVCKDYSEIPPPPNWDGSYTHKSK